MSDYFEIDFLNVESKKSGDAIAMRYCVNGVTTVHVTDGGYQSTGESLANFINKHYGAPARIDHVVATHPDGDHTGGLRYILENFTIGALWMHRPWNYADELIHRFSKFKNVESLKKRLREIYPNIAALEEIAEERGISIREPFQGELIGAFTVLTPSKLRYLDLVIESEKTPEAAPTKSAEPAVSMSSLFASVAQNVKTFIRALWGAETFSPEETSAENEMSVVQYACINSRKILLTGDTGREGLKEAAAYAPYAGLQLPGLDHFQVPHHGSRRNVSTDTLDVWLGKRLAVPAANGQERFFAIVSAAKADEDHPRRAVVRAMIHRGAKVVTTEEQGILISDGAPNRGWVPVKSVPYPEDQEE